MRIPPQPSGDVVSGRRSLEEGDGNCFANPAEELRDSQDQLGLLRDRLSLTLESSGIGLFDWNITTGATWWSPTHEIIFGYEPGTCDRSYEDFARRVHPEDLPGLEALMREWMSQKAFETEYRVVWPDGSVHWVQGRGRIYHDAEGRPIRMAGIAVEITDRKQSEANQALLADVLRILNRGGALRPAIAETLRRIRQATGFNAVGLRLRLGDDCPYYAESGFPEDFLREENFLCAQHGDGGIVRDADGRVVLECNCGLVLSGRTDPRRSCFTEGGSFWTNASTELLVPPWESDPRVNPRNYCIHAGYQSVGLFPVRAGEEILGVLQLNDRRAGRFTPERIAFYESLAQNIGLAIQRATAEAALQQSEARLAGVLEQLPVGVGLMDREGRWVVSNSIMRSTAPAGIPSRDPRRRERWRALTKEGRPLDPSQWPGARALRGEVVVPGIDFTYEDEDGRRSWLRMAAAPFYNAEGAIDGAVAVAQDVTESKRSEEAVRQANELLGAILNHTHMLAACMDRDFNFIVVNRPYAAADGREPEFFPGKNHFALYPNAENEAVFREVVATGRPYFARAKPFEYAQSPERGTSYWDWSLIPIADGEGRVRLLVMTLADVTAVKQMEDDLRAAKAAAEAASVAKSQFLANMSHEIRTPMSAILGMTDLALAEDLSPAVRDYLDTVRTSANAMLFLLNELLDFSRIEAGKLVLESTRFCLWPLVEETVKSLPPPAAGKNVALRVELDADVPEEVIGDRLRLRQVLVNLLSNALKFTEQGEVVLRVAVDSRTPETACVRFAVCDTGIGIAAEHLAHIFDPFTQADASTTRKYGGSGLGLAISSSLVKLMGGRIGVESRLGQGSCFHFAVRLPIPAALRSTAEPCRPADLGPLRRPLRVLVVEDTPANQKLLARILEKRGHQASVASNGLESLEMLGRQEFDVVLMDISMPVMDGFQATAAIRAMDQRRRLPIIAMTAHALKGDDDRCLAAGMDAYLSKPVNTRDLLELVERLGG